MENNQFKEMLEKSKPKPSIKVTFTINDMPLWLMKEFKSDIKTKYNDVYWTKLLDVMRKAQAYDYLMAGEFPDYNEKEDVEEPIEQPKQEDKGEEVITMGSRYSMKKR
jgi:hypothetical protein